jgi:glycosyltransferase involved in cell wall biosynthesis
VEARGGARVTVVIPAHDEAAAIGDVVRDAVAHIALRVPGDVLVVDDGSTDATPEIVARLAAATPQVGSLRLDRNHGQGPALYRAFDATSAEWLCQIDGDGQVEPADFWRLWPHREQADLILGVRRIRADPLHRRVLTRAVSRATSAAAGRRLEDAAAPLRLIRRDLWEDVRTCVDDDALAMSILVSVAAARRGWRVLEVPVRHHPRRHGRSHLRGLRLLRFIMLAARELLTLDRRMRELRPVASPPLAGV